MITVAVITSNCAKQKQSVTDLSRLIEETLSEGSAAPDILAVGFQEVAPIHEACFQHQDGYIQPFVKAVPTDYSLAAKSVCGGTGLLVFTRRNAPTITEIKTDITAFGWLWSTLKGAALVSVKFGNQGELHLVCAHLAAGSDHVNERNRDFEQIYSAFDLLSKLGQVVVFGDLNYRTQNGLWATDELTNELIAEKTAWGLKEALVTFQPTYKFAMGSDNYVTNRIKSYCDRILYRPMNSTTKILHYSAAQSKLYTDHRSVKMILETELSDTSMNGENALMASNLGAVKPTTVVELENRQLTTYLADAFLGSALYVIATKMRRLALGSLLTLGIVYALFFR